MVTLPTKTNITFKRIAKIAAVVLIVALATWFIIINPIIIRKEKSRFESASSSLTMLAKDMSTYTAFTIVERKDEKNCGRANLKSEEGPLLCTVRTVTDYKVGSVSDANQILSELKRISTYPLREGPLAKSLEFVPSENKSVQIIYQDIGSYNELSCALSYEYYPPANSNLLRVVASCGGPALSEHYPIADS